MKHSITLLVLFLLGGLLLAETGSASICDTRETVIFFGNGIKTVEKKAYDSRNIIKQRLQVELPPEDFKLLEFDIAYNKTHSLPLDLLESSVQILTGNTSRFWRFFWGLEIIPDWFSDTIINLATALDMSTLITSDSLGDHLILYRTKIAEGKRVLLVAHSQGSLYGNLAYRLLNDREKRSFAMVAVANVDNNVLGNGAPYTTLAADKVVAALTNLSSPSQILEPGVMTVSLTWGSQPDMDLHMYEPNGMHVCWYDPYGFSGELDHDDRTGRGPEHYSVPSCETLERGVYEVGLDYFKGYGPEVATVLVQAGLLVRTFTIPMPSELYGDPDYPEIIANISVRNNENGELEFNIY